MTVQNDSNVKTYTGNGVTTVFPYDFFIPGDSATDQQNVEVTLLEIATGIEGDPLNTALWSITGVGDENYGNVTYTGGGTPLPATHKINIRRVLPYEQNLDLTTQSAYFPELLEEQLDLIVYQIQQLAEEAGRSVKVGVGASQTPDELIDSLVDAAADAEAAATAAAASASTASGSASAAASSAAAAAASAATFTALTTTELLTGTDTTKYATADAIAALWEKGADIASAGTFVIGEGDLHHVTGTTGITDIDFNPAKDGRRATLIFDGILTLTHSSTLNLPGAANITTAVGDRCEVVQENGDTVYVVNYTRANGQPLVGGGVFTVSYTSAGQTITASGSLTLAHGLGAAPKLIQVRLKCTIAELGYSINDEVIINPGDQDPGGSTGRGVTIVPDATNINVRYSNQAVTIALLRKDTGAAAGITNGNWQLIVRAWA